MKQERANQIDWKQILFIMVRQTAYLVIFVTIFFWANILTIISLFLSFFKQPINEEDLRKIYKNNFKKVDKLL